MQLITLKHWIILFTLFLTVGISAFYISGENSFIEAEPEIDYRAPKTVIFPRLEPTPLRPGEEARAVIEIKMLDGFHIYSLIPSEEEDVPPPTSIQWTDNSLQLKGPVYETAPTVDFDKVIGITLAYHEGTFKLYQNLKIPEDFPLGKTSLEGTIKYQACALCR